MATRLLSGADTHADKNHAGGGASRPEADNRPLATSWPAARLRGASVDGPARYFADHPLAYGLALAGSAGTALYALAIAARPGRPHRVMWLALGANCAAQAVGIIAATELSRRRPRSGSAAR